MLKGIHHGQRAKGDQHDTRGNGEPIATWQLVALLRSAPCAGDEFLGGETERRKGLILSLMRTEKVEKIFRICH
jgi:hypothetical protein